MINSHTPINCGGIFRDCHTDADCDCECCNYCKKCHKCKCCKKNNIEE